MLNISTKIAGAALLGTTLFLTGCGVTNPINKGNGGMWSDVYRCGGKPSYTDEGHMVFTPKNNSCGNGMGQRVEVRSSKVLSQKTKAKYVLNADVAMTIPGGWNYDNSFTLLQVASMTKACTPAAHVSITINGPVMKSGYEYKEDGKIKCEWGSVPKAGSDWKMPVDGTEVNLRVEYDFKGNHDVSVRMYADGEKVVDYDYVIPTDKNVVSNKEFRLKFGVYSENFFDYRMVVKNFSVNKVKSFEKVVDK